MNEKKQNTYPTEAEKEMTEAVPTVDTTTIEPNKMPDMDNTEETSTESLKALQKEVAEKEQQINQQLEMLWASGTKQMLGDHTAPFVIPTQQNTVKTTPSIQQSPAPLKPTELPVVPIEQQANKETVIEKQQDVTSEHGTHELVPVEDKIEVTEKKEKVKKTTKKKSGSSTKKKKESS